MKNSFVKVLYRMYHAPACIYHYVRCKMIFGKIGTHTYISPPFTVQGGGGYSLVIKRL